MEKLRQALLSRRLQIVSKLVLFGVIALWDLLFLWMALAFLTPFQRRLVDLDLSSGIVDFLSSWYLVTAVLIGAWAAVKAFKIVLKWEKAGSNSDGEDE